MDWTQPKAVLEILTVLTLGASLAHAADLPQLGKGPTRDVVAAMTREEKVSLVVGTGMNMPFLPEEMRGASQRQ